MDEWVLVLILKKWEKLDKTGGFQTIEWETLQRCTVVHPASTIDFLYNFFWRRNPTAKIILGKIWRFQRPILALTFSDSK